MFKFPEEQFRIPNTGTSPVQWKLHQVELYLAPLANARWDGHWPETLICEVPPRVQDFLPSWEGCAVLLFLF